MEIMVYVFVRILFYGKEFYYDASASQQVYTIGKTVFTTIDNALYSRLNDEF
jgi:hypothetical protein